MKNFIICLTIVFIINIFATYHCIYVLRDGIQDTRNWITNLQHVICVTHVSNPCLKCGNNVYNVLQFGDGPYISNSNCAKCGQPHKDEESRLIKLFKEK